MDELTKLKAQVYDLNIEIQRLQAIAQQAIDRINKLEAEKNSNKKS